MYKLQILSSIKIWEENTIYTLQSCIYVLYSFYWKWWCLEGIGLNLCSDDGDVLTTLTSQLSIVHTKVLHSTSFRPTDGQFRKLTDPRLGLLLLLLVTETEVHQQPHQAGQQDGHCGQLKHSCLSHGCIFIPYSGVRGWGAKYRIFFMNFKFLLLMLSCGPFLRGFSANSTCPRQDKDFL